MKKNLLVAFFAITAIACNACDDSQNVKKGDTGTEGGYNISVLIDDVDAGKVDVDGMQDKIQTVTVNGGESKGIAISDIIEKASGVKTSELGNYLCDYESGEDGFRPSSKGDRCPPVNCSYATQSYFNVESQNLFYAEGTPMTNGCYNVKSLAKVLMYTIDESAVEISIYLDGERLDRVDASKLETVKTSDGKTAVKVSTLIEAAKKDGLDLSKTLCDFKTTDLVSNLDSSCAASTCDKVKDLYIVLDTRTVSDDKEAKACYEVSDVDAVYMASVMDTYPKREIEVMVDGKSKGKIDIATMSEKFIKSDLLDSVKVSDILTALGVDVNLTTSKCEGVSQSSNYRPSSKDRCSTLLTCDVVANATVAVLTGKLNIPKAENCYNTGNFDTLEITTDGTQPDPGTQGYIVKVVVDGGTPIEVDITKLEKNDGGYVDISTILAAAGVTADLTKAKCEGVSSDGYRPSTGKNEACHELLSCEDFAKGDVSLDDNHKLVIKGAEGCYGTKFLSEIDITTK